MKIIGLLRVKNEARWIREVVESLLPVCESVLVMDDHSTDDTAAICQSVPNVMVLPSPFDDLNEARDKGWLLEQAQAFNPDWVVFIDGDEVLEKEGPDKIRSIVQSSGYSVVSFHVVYYWNDVHTIRTDRIYSKFMRPSMFRVTGKGQSWLMRGGANLHCSNVPLNLHSSPILQSEVKLMHYGYIDAELRRKKYEWYNKIDPNNLVEDCYRHVIQGDPGGPEGSVVLRHAGPMSFQNI